MEEENKKQKPKDKKKVMVTILKIVGVLIACIPFYVVIGLIIYFFVELSTLVGKEATEPTKQAIETNVREVFVRDIEAKYGFKPEITYVNARELFDDLSAKNRLTGYVDVTAKYYDKKTKEEKEFKAYVANVNHNKKEWKVYDNYQLEDIEKYIAKDFEKKTNLKVDKVVYNGLYSSGIAPAEYSVMFHDYFDGTNFINLVENPGKEAYATIFVDDEDIVNLDLSSLYMSEYMEYEIYSVKDKSALDIDENDLYNNLKLYSYKFNAKREYDHVVDECYVKQTIDNLYISNLKDTRIEELSLDDESIIKDKTYKGKNMIKAYRMYNDNPYTIDNLNYRTLYLTLGLENVEDPNNYYIDLCAVKDEKYTSYSCDNKNKDENIKVYSSNCRVENGREKEYFDIYVYYGEKEEQN